MGNQGGLPWRQQTVSKSLKEWGRYEESGKGQSRKTGRLLANRHRWEWSSITRAVSEQVWPGEGGVARPELSREGR